MVYCVVSKHFKLDLNAVHVRDLNFVLWLEIFVHFDGQLKASHPILSYIPFYISYQDPRFALIVDSPLLLYVQICLPRFLPKSLIVGEARERGPWFIIEGSLMPVRDGSTNLVFHGRAEHIPIEDPIVLELANDMVQRCNMSLECWFLGA